MTHRGRVLFKGSGVSASASLNVTIPWAHLHTWLACAMLLGTSFATSFATSHRSSVALEERTVPLQFEVDQFEKAVLHRHADVTFCTLPRMLQRSC